MAWAIKYYTEFTDILGVDWKIDIEEDGFAETAVALQSTATPLSIEYLSSADDFIGNPVCGSVASISIYSDADFSYTEFYTYGRLTYRVSIYYNTTLYWQGYINAEGYQEPYDGISYPVVISASDMLGQLKDRLYKYTTTTTDDTYYNGLRAESQIVLDILAKINITQFTEYVNIYENSMVSTDTDSPFNQVHIDVDVFKDRDCYYVLSEILKKYNAVIRQVAGEMIIYRPVDLKYLPVKGRTFTAVDTSSAATDLNAETLFDRSFSTSDFHDTNGGSLSIIAPAKKISLNQDYGYKDSWIENYEFKNETWSGSGFSDWSIHGIGIVLNINYSLPEEKDGVLIQAESPQYGTHIFQTFGTYLKATTDMCVLSFDYYLYSYKGADLSNITISMKIKADNANKWLGVVDEEKAAWYNTEVYVDVTEASITNGRNGWVTFTRSIPTGLPADGPYTIEVFAPYCSTSDDFYCAFKNIEFRSTSTKTYTKRVKKSFWQRLEGQIGWGELQIGSKYKRVKVIEPADDKNTVEYTHVKTNAIEGRDLEFNYILGDVPSTSTPASDADTDLDNIIEQFSGALVYGISDLLAHAATMFVTNHASDYSGGGVTVTSSGSDIIFKATVPGTDFSAPHPSSISNTSGDLTGTPATSAPKHVHNTTAVARVDKITFSDPVAREDRILVTGTGGNADVTCENLTENMSWDTDVGTTVSNFVSVYASYYDAVGVVLDYTGNTLIFTAKVPGTDFTYNDTAIVNNNGDLNGTVTAPYTANVVGSSAGDCNITCEGLTKHLDFNTNVTQTLTDFVTNYAADYLAHPYHVVVTRSGKELFFTAETPGVDFTENDTAIANVTPNLNGTVTDHVYSNVVAVARVDTITLSGTTGTADIVCDGVTQEVIIVSAAYSPTSIWASRGNSEDTSLLDLIGDEIKEQYARPKLALSVPIVEKGDTSALPHINILSYFRDNLNVNKLPISTYTLSNCTLVANWPYLRFTSTNTDPTITSGTISVKGWISRYLNIRYKIITGDPAPGQIFYSTSGHGSSESYTKRFQLIADDDWHTLVLDMSDLTAGDDDWVTNTITSIRIDLVQENGIVIDLDWVGFPRKFVFGGGIFNVRDREWNIDLNEIIY